MATKVHCDRCGAPDRQVVQILGKDICNHCVAEFHAWVAAGLPTAATRPLQRHEIRAEIERLCRVHGSVTPGILRTSTSCSRSASQVRLSYWLGEGLLVRTSLGRYVLAQECESRSR